MGVLRIYASGPSFEHNFWDETTQTYGLQVVSLKRLCSQSMGRVCPELSVQIKFGQLFHACAGYLGLMRVLCARRMRVWGNFERAPLKFGAARPTGAQERVRVDLSREHNAMCCATGATLGTPFKSEPFSHDLVLSTKFIARRRVDSVLGFESDFRAWWSCETKLKMVDINSKMNRSLLET